MAKTYTAQEIEQYTRSNLDKQIAAKQAQYDAAGAARGLTQDQVNNWTNPGFAMVNDAYNKGIGTLDKNRTYSEAEAKQIVADLQRTVKDTASSYNAAVPKPTPNANAYTPYDVSAAYGAAQDAYRQAQEYAYQQQKAAIDYQQQQLAPQYDAVRSKAYTQARTSAIGNNEALAAQGLAGGLYGTPASGVSESSRIAQNTALGNDLNAATLAEQQERDALAQALIEAGYTRDANVASYIAETELQKAAAQQAENQFAANYALQIGDMVGSFNGQKTLAAKQAEEAQRQYNESLAYQKEQDAYNAAMTEVTTFKRVLTEETAKILGVPVGTTLAQLQGVKAGGSTRRRSGSGGDDDWATDTTGDEPAVTNTGFYDNNGNLTDVIIYQDPSGAGRGRGTGRFLRVSTEDFIKGIANGTIKERDTSSGAKQYYKP